EERAGRNADAARIRAAEAERLWDRVPAGAESVALTRTGSALGSVELAAWLERRALEAHPAVAFLIGGALGLADEAVARCSHTLRLTDMALRHEPARFVLVEQLYRAGTIARNEPDHKGGA